MSESDFWKGQSDKAETKAAKILAFGAHAGAVLVERRLTPMEKALRRLVFAARISGGVAGRDPYLCAACDEAEAVLGEGRP